MINTRTKFAKKLPKLYRYLVTNDRTLLDEIMPPLRRTWTLVELLVDAKKYKTRRSWSENSLSAYQFARKHGYYVKCTSHMRRLVRRDYWTIDILKKTAKKYKTRNEFKNKHYNAYSSAVRQKKLDVICKHMPKITRWDFDTCRDEALKYETIKDWRKNSAGSYVFAIRNEYIKDCVQHMRPGGGKFVINLSTNVIYNSLKDASDQCLVSRVAISECIRGFQKHAGGNRWAYYDKPLTNSKK